MKNLLKKEFSLAMHPTVIMFIFFVFMMLIPNYMYYVTYFYITLALFFTFLSGRENNDIFYTMLLPIKKNDVVKSRFAFVVIIELIDIVLSVPCLFIRNLYKVEQNLAGMDANVAMIGFAFLLFGIFNYSFLTSFYKNPNKVGKAFAKSSIFVFLYVIIIESMTFFVPIYKKLDTPLFENNSLKIPVLICGALLFTLLTFLAYKKSCKYFEKFDY